MRSDVVSLCACCTAVLPGAGKTEVVCAFAADMVVAEMVVESLWIWEGARASVPLTEDDVGVWV